MILRRLQAETRAGQGGVRFDASEPAIFGPIDIFVKRCKKLIDLFTTIHQFSVLAQVCLGVHYDEPPFHQHFTNSLFDFTSGSCLFTNNILVFMETS